MASVTRATLNAMRSAELTRPRRDWLLLVGRPAASPLFTGP